MSGDFQNGEKRYGKLLVHLKSPNATLRYGTLFFSAVPAAALWRSDRSRRGTRRRPALQRLEPAHGLGGVGFVVERTAERHLLPADRHAALRVDLFDGDLVTGSDARMNTPGRAESNWAWRFRGGALTAALGRRLRETTEIYGRLP
jgi:hypothetical protein